MKTAPLTLALTILCLLALPNPAQAAKAGKINKAAQAAKERLVLMPLRVAEEDKNLQGAMEAALVQGLQQKYEVFSGEQVAQKAKQIFNKESHSAKKECDETRCMQGIAEAFQAELIATANVTKRDGGYFLALSIQNIFDNLVVYSNAVPCKNCDSFQVVEKLKELVGAPIAAVPSAMIEPAPVKASDPESVTWNEAQKGNTMDDYQVYLDAYPKGNFVPFAKAKIMKLKEAEQVLAEQQEQQAWDVAQKENNTAGFKRYLQAYPKGKFVASAKRRLRKMAANPSASVQEPMRKYSDDCVFPNSSDMAPHWTCDEPVEGYGTQVVGSASAPLPGQSKSDDRLPSYQSALLDALARLADSMKVRVDNGKKIKKQFSVEKIGNITVEHMVTLYTETKNIVGVERLSMKRPCAYTMKRHTAGVEGEVMTVVDSLEEGKRCTIQDVVHELEGAGVEVVDQVFSQKGELFILLGITEEAVQKITEKAVRNTMESDKAAWEEFKNSKAAEEQAADNADNVRHGQTPQ